MWSFEMMKKLLFLLAVFSILAVSDANSYAQTSSPGLAIYMQAEIHDSNGNLVGYIESARVRVLDAIQFNQLIDANAGIFHKSIISINGQQFEMIKASSTITLTSATIVSQNFISAEDGKKSQILALATHDGYPVVAGDKVTVYWTILRPAS
jgi:hypothetical protein